MFWTSRGQRNYLGCVASSLVDPRQEKGGKDNEHEALLYVRRSSLAMLHMGGRDVRHSFVLRCHQRFNVFPVLFHPQWYGDEGRKMVRGRLTSAIGSAQSSSAHQFEEIKRKGDGHQNRTPNLDSLQLLP